MKKRLILLITAFVAAAAILAACGGTTATVEQPAAGSAASGNASNPATIAVSGGNGTLTTDYRDALDIDLQLAIGTMQLENGDLSVSADQAATLLPLWRVLDSLKQSGNASEAETSAVIKQITGGMTPEQISSIASMELTQEKVQTMMEEGTLGFARRAGRGDASGEGTAGGGFPGGGPGGGFPGGPPPGGGFPGGGPGGDPSAFATGQAELAAAGVDPAQAFLERAAIGMVVRLLENKTGEAPAGGFGAFGVALSVISEETGMSAEELRAAMEEGQTFTMIVEAAGKDVAAIKDSIVQKLGETTLPDGQDPSAWVDDMFTGTFGPRSSGQSQP